MNELDKACEARDSLAKTHGIDADRRRRNIKEAIRAWEMML